MAKEGVSKWQRKSLAVNAIRWDFEKLFNDDFEPEEKKTAKYKELVATAYAAVDHSIPEHLIRNAETNVESKEHKVRRRWSYAIVSTITSGVTALIIYAPDLLPPVIEIILHFFGHGK